MQNIRWLLNGQWHEFSGGSRPGTNLIRMAEGADGGCILELSYVFDWDTEEHEHLVYVIPPNDFERLIEELLDRGHSEVTVVEGDENFTFAWRITEDTLQFRLDGTPRDSNSGHISFAMLDYREILKHPSPATPPAARAN